LYGITEPGVANCDVLLGDLEAAHRGLGPRIVRRLLEEHIFADPRVVSCVIDPLVGNAIAIRAYEKAGFHFQHVAPEDGEGHAVYLMALRREEFGSWPPSPAVWLRPARTAEIAVAVDIDHDAGRIYADAGLAVDSVRQHALAQAERARWAEAIAGHRLLFACRGDGQAVGFSSVTTLDGHPHLDQICVRAAATRQGVGRMLLERALRWSTREGELWLTTYDHLAWNGPWYERLGFSPVPESEHGPELRRTLAAERAVLPAPGHRVALRYRHRPSAR
jgi:GNAT superfamily N-acetyltransferase